MRFLRRLLAIVASVATRLLGSTAAGQCLRFASCVAAALVLANFGEAFAAFTVNDLNASDPMTWLVKSVCTNAQGQPIVADPYYGCPNGIRKINPGEPLPYHNMEQEGYQRRDSFPLYDPIQQKNWIIADYDYSPFNIFNLYNSTDGYDVYNFQNGWVSAVNTSDGGGYGQTFFTSECTVGGAWVLFPMSGFLTGGQANPPVPIADTYWEQNGQSYPGACPEGYSSDTQTSWSYQQGFKFGGVNGNPVKVMDTVISYHGFRPGSNDHLEVFYFTREYGITRWEVWTPQQQTPTPSPTQECVVPESGYGPGTEKYQNVIFVVEFCHDWSVYVPALASTPALPVWPIPNINMLQNPHFAGPEEGSPSDWISDGVSATSEISKSCRDTGSGIPTPTGECSSPTDRGGVAYAQITCGVGPGCSDFTNALSQVVTPAKGFAITSTSGVPVTYGFGINARTEPVRGNPASRSATIGIEVEQFDDPPPPYGTGKLLKKDWTQAPVASDNGTPGETSLGEADSVYLSSAFVCKMITLAAGTKSIRFLISPQVPQVKFDVLNAWFAPYPVPVAPWAGNNIDPCSPAAGQIASGHPVDRPWYLVYPSLHAPLSLLVPDGNP